MRDRRADALRGFITGGFIFRVLLVAEGRPVGVERYGDMRWLVGVHNIEEGVDEAKDRRNILAFGVDTWIADEAEIGAVDDRHAVDEKQFFSHADNPFPLGL